MGGNNTHLHDVSDKAATTVVKALTEPVLPERPCYKVKAAATI